jgi:iron complex outermembrane receptor protein
MIELAAVFSFQPAEINLLRTLRSLILVPCLAGATIAFAQTSDSTQQPSSPPQPGIQPVTTTVVVQGHVSDDYLPTQLSVGSLDSLPLASAPVSATVVTRDLMNDQVSRLLSDVVKNDASVGEDYAPVGYYGDYQIRGFTIDLATGLQINGMPVAGEQDVPLENKERYHDGRGIVQLRDQTPRAGKDHRHGDRSSRNRICGG